MSDNKDQAFEAIVERIQKLKKLAKDKGTTEGEINAALHAVGVLMARYQVTEADLAERESGASEIVESEDFWRAKRIKDWRASLLHAVAAPNGCILHAVLYDDGSRGVRVTGRARDIAIVRALHAWLEPEAIRLAKLSYFGSKPSKRRETRWIMGFSVGVLAQLEQGARAADPNQAALVHVDSRRSEAETWLRQAFPVKEAEQIKNPKLAAEADVEALCDGFEVGHGYHLGKRLGPP